MTPSPTNGEIKSTPQTGSSFFGPGLWKIVVAATILLIVIGASLPFALEAPKAVDIYIDVALMAIAGILALIAGWWARHESSGIKGALLLGAISLIVFGLIFSFTPDPVKFRAAQFVFSFAVSFFIDTGWNAIKSRTAAKSAA